jgi:hypothetical protein
MYRKTGARRRGHFLRALAVCGNATLAAERAGVSRAWVYKERLANPKFDSDCRAAKAAAGVGLRCAQATGRMPKGWSRLGGEALVVRLSNRPTRGDGA